MLFRSRLRPSSRALEVVQDRLTQKRFLQGAAIPVGPYAEASSAAALIAHLRLTIEKMRREIYGLRSERKVRLLEQLELELE